MDLSGQEQFSTNTTKVRQTPTNVFANGKPPESFKKYDINERIQKLWPDKKLFVPLNTTSAKAMVAQSALGQPVMGPTSIKSTAKSFGLD